jgi:hypothetical protein
VGGLTELGSKLLPRRFKIDYSRSVGTPLFRYGFLGAYLLLPMVGFANICCSYCSFSTIPEFFGTLFKPQMWLMLATGYRFVSVLLFVFVLGIIFVKKILPPSKVCLDFFITRLFPKN